MLWVKLITAAFDEQYTATSGSPRRPAWEAKLMILPPRPWAIIWRAAGLEHEEQPLDVHRVDPPVALPRDLDGRREVEQARIVDQDVERSPAADHRLDRALDCLLLRDVERDPDRRVTRRAHRGLASRRVIDLARRCDRAVLVEVGDGDARALPDVALGDRAADPARTARHDRDLAVEPHSSPPDPSP